jgi:hypothetical protein
MPDVQEADQDELMTLPSEAQSPVVPFRPRAWDQDDNTRRLSPALTWNQGGHSSEGDWA